MATSSPTQVVFTSTVTGALVRVISIAVGLITVPIIVSQLGKTEYGLWVLIGQTISFLTLSELGISGAIGRFVARDKNTASLEDLNKLINTGISLSLIASNLVVLFTIVLMIILPDWLEVDQIYYSSVRWVLLLAGISLSIQIPMRISFGILRGYQKYGLANSLQIGLSIINLVGVIFLYNLDRFSLILLAAVYFSASVFYHLSGVVVVKRAIKGIRISLRDFTRNSAGELLGLGLSALLISVSSTIYRQGIVLASGKLLTVEQAGIYGVVLGLITMISGFLTQLTAPLTTLASEIQADEDLTHLESMTSRMMRIAFSLGGSVAIGIFFYGEEALRLWLRTSDWTTGDFHSAWIAMVIMGIGLAVGFPQLASRSILQGVGRHWHVTIGFLLSSLVALLLSIFLMSYGLGILGAALSWALVLILQGTVVYPPLISNFFAVKWWKMIPRAYLPGGIISAVLALTCYLMKTFIPPTSLGLLVLNIIVGILVGGSALFFISGLSVRQLSKLLFNFTSRR